MDMIHFLSHLSLPVFLIAPAVTRCSMITPFQVLMDSSCLSLRTLCDGYDSFFVARGVTDVSYRTGRYPVLHDYALSGLGWILRAYHSVGCVMDMIHFLSHRALAVFLIAPAVTRCS